MTWFHGVAEREHDIQNPTSPEKVRLLGERLRLGRGSLVLDVASGRGGPALILAETFGCRVVGVEKFDGFHAAALARARDRDLADRVEFHLSDAASFPLEPGAYDAALCLGATFVWGGLEATLSALAPAVRAGGHVAVGEPYWRSPPPADQEGDFVSLAETVERFERSGLPVVALIASSQDDWDRHESLHWQSIEESLAEHPEAPDADSIREEHERWKSRYLTFGRELLGWAIFVGWKRA